EVVDAAVEWLAALPAAPPAPRESRAAAGTDGIVVEHPVLIPTGSGLIGGVVSEPADIPVAAQLMFLHGAGDPRAGVNAHWSRTMRGLAALGYQVVRLDWAQTWESHSALPDGPIQDRKVPLPELVAWFRAHDEGRPFVLLGSCFGADAAAELAPDLHDLQALG